MGGARRGGKWSVRESGGPSDNGVLNGYFQLLAKQITTKDIDEFGRET